MSWNYSDHHSSLPYVDQYQSTAPLPSTPAQNLPSDWPTPNTQSRLTTTLPQSRDTTGAESRFKPALVAQETGLGLHFHPQTPVQPHFNQQTIRYTPTKLPSSSAHSPTVFHTPHTNQPSQPQPQSGSLCTPPLSAEQFKYPPQNFVTSHSGRMSQRRMSHGQRPVMGPPETPSRGTIPQSPTLFSNIPFSPDLFSQQLMDPQSAPVYPQQRLFWDPSASTPLQSTPQHFQTPVAFPNDFNASSFHPGPTMMPQHFETPQADLPYDLPAAPQDLNTSFMDAPAFPAPFQTSPRLTMPHQENPTQFLSSPARRFGGETKPDSLHLRRTVTELPAYHHQKQESKREKELLARTRRKSRTSKPSTDEDLVMKSVRRALSPPRNSRPGLIRSSTFAGVHSEPRRSSSTLDNISVGSSVSSRSTRAGRSSPIKKNRESARRASASATLRPNSSLSLEIDKNGVARTVMNALPEDEDEDMDDDTSDLMTSDDETDQHMLYSFGAYPESNSDTFSHGDARDELRSSAHSGVSTEKPAHSLRAPAIDPRLGGYVATSTIRRARGETLTSTNTDATNSGNAQQALRALMQGRSRSASSHASTSSMQFHSSPPVQPGNMAAFNASPTTITDPDLTPSTDADSMGSSGATRCICNSASPDGNIMIQCDSCSKWLHAKCIGLSNRNIPDIYICAFCEQTPVRGGSARGTIRQPSFRQSPLAHKSNRPRR